MTSSSHESESDPVFLEFQRGFDLAADKDAYLEEMRGRHPERDDFGPYAEMLRRLEYAGGRPEESVPERLGEFVLGRRISRSMGEVYHARQPSLERDVAVKIIRPGRTSPDACARFDREQKVMAKLHQTHIVPIHAAGQDGPLQYFVMPFIDGAALHQVVNIARGLSARPGGRTPPLSELAGLTASSRGAPTRSPSEAARLEASPEEPPRPGGGVRLSPAYYRSVAQVMADAGEALAHVHDANVIHRDLKPANLMVDRAGHCWLIDFGLAG
ncbi:MAG: protein kinase domain-containing protein, partial [Gemmataceae bacterium]